MRIFKELSIKILQLLISESEYSEELIRTSKIEDCVLLRIIWIQTLSEAGLTDSQIASATNLTQQMVNRCKMSFTEKSKQSFMLRYMISITRKLLKDYMKDIESNS